MGIPVAHRSFTITVLAALSALYLSVVASPASSTEARVARVHVALGVSVADPGRPGPLRAYIHAVGVRPASVMWFQGWDQPLYWPSQVTEVDSVGAVPIITWMPTHHGIGIPLAQIAAGRLDRY